MIIIPLTGKASLRNPPAITIAIILINCFVFFVLQAGDEKRYGRVAEFYFESGLARIELSGYLNYLRASGIYEGVETNEEPEEMDEDTLINFSKKMQNDPIFLNKLVNDEILSLIHI